MTLHREYEEAEKNNGIVSEEWDEVYDRNITTFMRKREHNPTVKEIKMLRKEICLNSLYYDDYQNQFMFDEWEVCDFFDLYLEHLGWEVQDKVGEQLENGISDDDWLNMMFELDTEEELERFFVSGVGRCYPFTQYYYEEVVEECGEEAI